MKNLLKILSSAFSKHLFMENGPFTGNAIKSVPELIFQFCFYLGQANKTSLQFLSILYFSQQLVPPKERQVGITEEQ